MQVISKAILKTTLSATVRLDMNVEDDDNKTVTQILGKW